MQEHSFLPNLNDNDVIEFQDNNIMKIRKLKEAIIRSTEDELEPNLNSWLSKRGVSIPSSRRISDDNNQTIPYDNKWLEKGVYCEILQPGSNNWQKGKLKLRLSLEFEPDEPEIKEPESPLDDIRQAINQ